MIDTNRLVQTFMDLVRIDSPSGHEGPMAEEMVRRLSSLATDVTRDDVGNVLARVDGVGEPIILTAHLDTVMPGIGIEPVVRDGAIHSGPDTILGSDDKAGVAIIVEILTSLSEGSQNHRPIEVLLTIGEEIGLLGAKGVDVSWFQASMGVGLDASGDPGAIVVHAPTKDGWHAVVRGRAAHAGARPELGISAIQAAAAGIARMRLGRIDEETTANVGFIEGGVATNVVPETVTLRGESRSRDVAKLDRQIAHMSQALEEGVQQLGARVEITVDRSYQGYHLRPDEPIVQHLSSAIESVGIEPVLLPTGGGSDSNVFIARGLCVAQISMGMRNVHTCDEHIAIRDLETTARIVEAYVTT